MKLKDVLWGVLLIVLVLLMYYTFINTINDLKNKSNANLKCEVIVRKAGTKN